MNGRELIVGVTGGIAAYKTAAMVSQLVQAGAGVTVVLTDAGAQFVGETTFAALTGRPVVRRVIDPGEYPFSAHITLADKADMLVVAPATADFLAKAANGLADDLLSTLYLAFTGPAIFAPAMSSDMWQHHAVQRNAQQLRDDGVQLVGPEVGWLACRKTGPGRMAGPESLLEAIRLRLDEMED